VRIDYKDNLFYGLGSWADRDAWKAAGFKWSSLRKAWITSEQAIATRVDGAVWTQRAMAHVEHQLEVAEVSKEMSWRASTDFMPPAPPGLAFLPYQRAGIEYALARKDTLIADQPGLGKTIQAVGVINSDESVYRVLIICPASLKENWRREVDKWMTADLSIGIAETQYKEKVQVGFYKNGKPKFQTITHPRHWPGTDVVIINYDILDRFPEIKAQAWDLVVCDECHALKTSTTNRTLFVLGCEAVEPWKRKKLFQAKTEMTDGGQGTWISAVEANRRIFLSGTPMMSRPVELWPIVRAFDPQGLGKKFETFAYRYCGAWTGSHGLDTSGATNLEELGDAMRSKFMVRRLKREVLPELPPKRRVVVTLDSPEIKEMVAREDELAQALRLYETTFTRSPTVAEEARLGEEAIQKALDFGFDKISDPDRPNAREINLDYAAAVLGLEPPAVAIMFEEMASIRRELGLAKLSAITPWVTDFLEGGEKLLLFAYHSDVVKALAERLHNWNPAVIYGGTPLKRRQLEVDKFQDDEACRLFIGNIQAAGVGFTMTRAHDIAFAEGDWVPSMIEQCEDRACRIGQTAEKIMSYFLVANGSLDSRIAQAAKLKEDNIQLTLGA
jgi:SNF2 family DNA or RNA helicase